VTPEARVRDVTRSLCVIWLLCVMTHSYVQKDWFICVSPLTWHLRRVCVTWLVHYVWCDSRVWYDSLICATWLIYMWAHRRDTWGACAQCDSFFLCDVTYTCDMTHSFVLHDWFICATWLIHMCETTAVTPVACVCALTHSLCVTWLMCAVTHSCDVTHSYVWAHGCYTWSASMWRDSFIMCDMAHECAMTHSDVWHDHLYVWAHGRATCGVWVWRWLVHHVWCDSSGWRASVIYVTWLIHIYESPRPIHLRRVCVTWLVHSVCVCDVTRS